MVNKPFCGLPVNPCPGLKWQELRVVDHALKSLEQKRRREDAIRQRQGLTQRMCRGLSHLLPVKLLLGLCFGICKECFKEAQEDLELGGARALPYPGVVSCHTR